MRALVTMLLLLGPAVGDPPGELGRAPDGRRGFGSEVTARELERLMRSPEGDDARFLAGLSDTASGVRILVATLLEEYRRAGYLELLGADAAAGPGGELGALHAALDAVLERPRRALRAPAPRGESAARVALDVRLRVRRGVLAGWEREAEELRRGLAVLQAAVSGHVVLTDEEARRIAARVDLAASRLRAVRNDLTALRPMEGAGASVSLAETAALRERARDRDAGAWDEAWGAASARVQRDAEAMAATLFTTRLDRAVRAELEARDRDRARAAALRDEAETLLPHTPAGEAAPAAVRELPRHRRIELAMFRAREGLALEPLDEDLAYLAAWSADYLWGGLESRPLYDRYLALRGIRVHDHRTLRGRRLTRREEEAILAVQRGTTPGMPPR